MPLNGDRARSRLHRNRRALSPRGFALIEVLVALVVLAFGMLGLAGMLVIGNKANSSSYLKQQAIQSAYDIVDRMRANKAQAVLGAYNQTYAPSGAPDCTTAACSATQVAAFDLSYWFLVDLAQLPSGTGTVSSTASGPNTLVTVTVQWDDRPAQATLGAATATATATPNLAQFIIKTLL